MQMRRMHVRVCQARVNAALDTSTCLMDPTSLDMVIIMDTQEQRDLTLSQQIPDCSHLLSNYMRELGTAHYTHNIYQAVRKHP